MGHDEEHGWADEDGLGDGRDEKHGVVQDEVKCDDQGEECEENVAQHGGEEGDEHGVQACEVLDVDVVAVEHDGVRDVVLHGVHGEQLDEE